MPRHPGLFTPPLHQPQLPRGERRTTGVYYTPPEVVRLMVAAVLGPTVSATNHHGSQIAPRLLDPSCGAGEFAVEAFRQLRRQYGAEAARDSIVAIDIDPTAANTTRERLIEIEGDFPARQVFTADALTSDQLSPESFDAILGNPPYVNIRELAKSHSPEQIKSLRQRFRSARGNFDLYVLFIERAIELLKPGGRCGLIVPNKWTTLDYARPCRELLLAHTTIEQVIDLSGQRVFAGANVYPQVLVFRKSPAAAQHEIYACGFANSACQKIPQQSLSADSIHFLRSLDIPLRFPTKPLGEIATLSCGTAGYSAQTIARRLRDAESSSHPLSSTADFITSGNIDRYAIRLGNVRYLNHTYTRPRLSLDAPELSAAKRRLFENPKIVIAGLSRRIEAAWDERGLALGVQVYSVSQWKVDPFYLLALLNSKLLSYLFATRYAAKRLAGGYLAMNKGQLCRLPICLPGTNDQAAHPRVDRLQALARDWHPRHEAEIDQLVYQLYGLNDAQIARIDEGPIVWHNTERQVPTAA